MTISMSVVGIFFGADLPLNADTLVIDVLASAKAQAAAGRIPNVSNFSYDLSNAPNVAATSFAATYADGFQGRGVGRNYPAGEYFLAEDIGSTPAQTVWQYYVLDANGKPVIRGVKFLDDPGSIVPVGGTLIWRLVSILTQPNPIPRLAAARHR